MADAAAVCLADQGHGTEISLRVVGEFRATNLLHRAAVTDRMQSTYDPDEATEFGAYGIAILVMRDQTGLTVQRAFKGDGFDYWLGTVDEEHPFQNLARLEVSGIRRAGRGQIAARMKSKLEQVHRSDSLLVAYVAVVEFSAPQVRVARR